MAVRTVAGTRSDIVYLTFWSEVVLGQPDIGRRAPSLGFLSPTSALHIRRAKRSGWSPMSTTQGAHLSSCGAVGGQVAVSQAGLSNPHW